MLLFNNVQTFNRRKMPITFASYSLQKLSSADMFLIL